MSDEIIEVTLRLKVSTAYHADSVLVPFLEGHNQELDEFGKEYRRAFNAAKQKKIDDNYNERNRNR